MVIPVQPLHPAYSVLHLRDCEGRVGCYPAFAAEAASAELAVEVGHSNIPIGLKPRGPI